MNEPRITPNEINDLVDGAVRSAINYQLKKTWQRESGTGLVKEKDLLNVARSEEHMLLVFQQYKDFWIIETHYVGQNGNSVYLFRRKD